SVAMLPGLKEGGKFAVPAHQSRQQLAEGVRLSHLLQYPVGAHLQLQIPARRPILLGLVQIQDVMGNFAGRPTGTSVQLAPQDHSTADAGVMVDQDEVLYTL